MLVLDGRLSRPTRWRWSNLVNNICIRLGKNTWTSAHLMLLLFQLPTIIGYRPRRAYVVFPSKLLGDIRWSVVLPPRSEIQP